MARTPEYQQFLDVVENGKQLDINPNEETIATSEEIGWWKQFQIRRAIHHARYDTATGVEIHLLVSHRISLPTTAAVRTNMRERK